ncbi:MAG TPA: Rha family transcriptional regulator [Burkholderiaceae bacterium]|nr:Rha family transcriptional regulator [Burkholderiaceae bacterium]
MATTKQKDRIPVKDATLTTSLNHTPNLVHLRKGVPITDSLAIAREFGRSHKNVLRTLDDLIGDGTISRLNFEPAEYVDEQGKPRRMIELDDRAALVAMPFIGGRKSRLGQVHLVNAFLAQRDLLSKTWTPQIIAARREAATGYRTMSAVLQMRRTEDGKETPRHVYSNEARLLNFALSGSFEAMDRETLSEQDLRALTSLEVRNSAMIAMGRPYAERKFDLMRYAEGLRIPRLTSSATASIGMGGTHV